MRLLIISITPFYGGGEAYIINLAKLLERNNIELHIICCSEYLATLCKEKTSAYTYLVDITSSKDGLIKAAKTVFKLNNEMKFDLVILNGQVEAHLCILLRLLKLKTLVIRHTLLSMTGFIKRYMFYISCLVSNRTVSVSQAVKAEFPLFLQNKIEIIHNWVECNDLSNQKKSLTDFNLNNEKKLKIYYIGRLDPGKNIEELILACKDIENLELNIVGNGPQLDSLKKKYSSWVVFHGFIDKEHISEHYLSADICVSCSSFEAFSLTVLESSCYGIPLILSDIPSHREASINGKGCILFKLHDVNDLRRKIISINNNRSKIQEMRRMSRLINGKFSYVEAEKKYLKLLNSF